MKTLIYLQNSVITTLISCFCSTLHNLILVALGQCDTSISLQCIQCSVSKCCLCLQNCRLWTVSEHMDWQKELANRFEGALFDL